MKKLIFFLILFLSLNGYAIADKNFSIQTGASASCSGGNKGTCDGIKDNDEWTYYGERTEGFGTITVAYSAEVTFAETALKITKTAIQYGVYGIRLDWMAVAFSVSLYYAGGWHEVDSGSDDTGDLWKYSEALGNWSNVTKIRTVISGTAESAYPSGEGYHGVLRRYTQELEAWGTSYEDSGIRYRKGDTTYSIACEDLEVTHKLRFRKGDTTVGLPLVDTGDGDASPWRIYDGAAVKALVKYE